MELSPSPFWIDGEPYLLESNVTEDGRWIYRHADTRRPYAYQVREGRWVIEPLDDEADTFGFGAWFAMVTDLFRRRR